MPTGELMHRRIFIFSLLSLSISACSSVDSAKRAAGDFNYAKKPEAKVLEIPKNLAKPDYSKEYAVSNKINFNGPIGDQIDIRAPSLVLPVAASSRVELNSNEAKIWFDKVLEGQDLEKFILAALKEQVEEDGVEFKEIDSKKHLYESGWFHKTAETGFLLWKGQKILASMRFQYQIETKPHHRSVAVIVNLIDFEGKNGSKKMDIIDKQRAEVAMLNEIVGQVDYKYRKKQRDNVLMRATQKIVTMGENPSGEPAYIIEMSKDHLWANLPGFFEKYGFTINDLNETKNIYYVDFVQPQNSLWDTMWDEEKPEVDLTNEKYQFALSAVEKKTALTIYDAHGTALTMETLERIFAVMEPGLSFRTGK